MLLQPHAESECFNANQHHPSYTDNLANTSYETTQHTNVSQSYSFLHETQSQPPLSPIFPGDKPLHDNYAQDPRPYAQAWDVLTTVAQSSNGIILNLKCLTLSNL